MIREKLFAIFVAFVSRDACDIAQTSTCKKCFAIHILSTVYGTSWSIKVGEIVHGKLHVIGHA